MNTVTIKAAVIAVIFSGSLLLAGCGTSSGDSGGAATPAPGASSTAATPASNANGTASACTIVTEADATTALGVDPGPGTESTQSGASSCTFGASPTLVMIDLLAAAGKAAYDHVRGNASAGDVVDIAGVGDGAFGVFKGAAAEIWFYKGGTMVSIGLVNASAPTPPQAEAVALAKTIAGRL